MSEVDDFQEEYGFSLGRVLGEGAYGIVYEATHKSTGLKLAIKKIPRHLLKGANLEQNITGQLNHHNIVKFLQVIETKHFMYLVMELISGGSLQQLIAERRHNDKPFSDQETAKLMQGLLSAVEHIHSKQVIHRDLKPDNILLFDKNDLTTLKVTDFGLSFQFENNGRLLSQRCGTFIFMAPEQLLGNQYGKPVDIWSCGIIMYLLFSMGKHPIQKHDNKEQFIQAMGSPFPELPNVHPLAYDLMKRLTSMSPFERYSAGQALMHPWITRRFEEEIPMNYQERILMFQQQVNFAQKLKLVFFLKYLQRNLEKRRILSMCGTTGTTTVTDFFTFSRDKSFDSPIKKPQHRMTSCEAILTRMIDQYKVLGPMHIIQNNRRATGQQNSQVKKNQNVSQPNLNSKRKVPTKMFNMKLLEVPTGDEITIKKKVNSEHRINLPPIQVAFKRFQ